MTDQPPQRTRLSKSKATASTSTIQTLEITTTAVVNTDIDHSPSSTATEEDSGGKPSRHHHHHHIRSPAFEAHSNLTSPLPSPKLLDGISTDLVLPPPLATKMPSEAIVALQDAVNVTQHKKCLKRSHAMPLFDSSFFSAALLIQWSNLMGPKVEKVWSVEPLEEKTQIIIGRQVLNGEMGRTLNQVEPKWIVLHRQAIICTAFLFHDPTLESLAAFVFVVPVRYLRNFSTYFNVLCDRAPTFLIEPLVKLRQLTKRQPTQWHTALNFFTLEKLAPFVKSIMDLESVSLPLDCVKASHTILDVESKQLLESPFIAKAITSHLQTFGSTMLVGNTLTSMNMVINTLALFLTADERSRSSHARKHHHYMPDLFLQGLLIQDVEEMETRLELAVLDSIEPTTLIDMTRLIVRKTPLYKAYDQLKYKYYTHIASKLEESFTQFTSGTTYTKQHLNDWSKRSSVFEKTDLISPMVQTLIDDLRRIPVRMRESYIRQWRRCLVKKALAMIKFVEDETLLTVSQALDSDLVTRIMNALALYDMSDFIIVLTQAEKLKPGMVSFVYRFSNKL